MPTPTGKTATDEDPANGGIRREPELPDHEEIAPPEPSVSLPPEVFLVDETDDEEAIKAPPSPRPDLARLPDRRRWIRMTALHCEGAE